MEEPRNRYILLKDCIEETLKRSVPRQADHFCDLTWSLFSSPRQVPKGELLEALPESEQPGVSTRIALGGIDRKLRLECRMEDVKKLTPEEADLLLGISSTKSRFEIYFDGKRLDFGKRLEHGSHVLVSIQGVSEKLPGVVRFKGGLPNLPGTMFGVELHVHQNPGFGTCDGTYGNKQYFKCAPDSGVFVGLDKLAPLKDDNSELTTPSDSPKRDDHCEVNMTELDLVFPSLSKGKSDSKLPQARDLDSFKISQRVVTFCDKGAPLRGTVRYTGDIEDSSGHVKSVAGLELDETYGHGTGRWKGNQLFVCKRDHACFVDIETIMLEEDFDKDAERAKKKTMSQKQDKQPRDLKMRERRLDKEMLTGSLSYNVQREASDIQHLSDDVKRLKLEKVQWEKERTDLLARRENLEKELQEFQQEKDEIVQQNHDLQTHLRAKEYQVHELETSLATAQQLLVEYQQKEPCDWVISRDEVEMTDKCLGVGGWGNVSLGTFRGCKVAVKQIHELILSPYNRRLFEREMNIASKCRHPCLLQFIGATNDDGIPLFISELLETSLRALLGQRQLAEVEISVISLDVSLALNYLHNMKPSPIIHRDVSSANVLLWQQGDQWRGKLSDYGTAKIVQQTMTEAPGAAIYSAPEAVSSNQTSKVDVYSFGVLLCEMCIHEMPDPDRRHEQVLLVRNQVFRNGVRACLQVDPAMRPNMDRIIQEIKKFEGCDQAL